MYCSVAESFPEKPRCCLIEQVCQGVKCKAIVRFDTALYKISTLLSTSRKHQRVINLGTKNNNLAISYIILNCYSGYLDQVIDYCIRPARVQCVLISPASIIETFAGTVMLKLDVVRLYGWPMEPQSMCDKATEHNK